MQADQQPSVSTRWLLHIFSLLGHLYNQRWFQVVLIIAVGILTYVTVFSFPFVFDDQDSIVRNPVVKDLSRFLRGEGYAYNPRRFIGYLTFALNYHFGALDVFGYHVVNVAIHITNGLLVYSLSSITLALIETGDRQHLAGIAKEVGPLNPAHYSLLPLITALLFVVHPIQTQAVTYIVQRLASLATLFYLGALVCYAKGRIFSFPERRSATGHQNNEFRLNIHRSPIAWFFLSLIFALLAMRTKEIAATLPLAILLYEICFFGTSLRRNKIVVSLSVVGLFSLAALLLWEVRATGHVGDSLRVASESITRTDYFITQFAVVATYLRLLILPFNQNLDYDYPLYTSVTQPLPLLGLLLHMCLLGGALWALKKANENQPPTDQALDLWTVTSPGMEGRCHFVNASLLRLVSFGILWFYLTLVVESSFIPIQDVIAEHRLYLSSVGLFLALVTAGARLAGRVGVRTRFLIVTIIILALIAGTWKRNHVWRSEEALWQDVAKKSPGKPRVLTALANLSVGKGDQEGAIQLYTRAVQRDPDYFVAHLNLGILLLQKDMTDKAIYHLQRARELNPRLASAYYHLGVAYYKKGLLNNSNTFLSRAVDLEPDNQSYRYALQQVSGASSSSLSH